MNGIFTSFIRWCKSLMHDDGCESIFNVKLSSFYKCSFLHNMIHIPWGAGDVKWSKKRHNWYGSKNTVVQHNWYGTDTVVQHNWYGCTETVVKHNWYRSTVIDTVVVQHYWYRRYCSSTEAIEAAFPRFFPQKIILRPFPQLISNCLLKIMIRSFPINKHLISSQNNNETFSSTDENI